jgi:dienelactone hydrolase
MSPFANMNAWLANAPRLLATLLGFLPLISPGQEETPLPGTLPLTLSGDLSSRMVAGIHRFLLRETERSVAQRAKFWTPDFTSQDAYVGSVQPNRERLRHYLGVVDERLPVKALEFLGSTEMAEKVARAERYTVYAVRWPVFEGVCGEGLLLQPNSQPVARVVAIPDADQTPEMLVGLAPGIPPESQFARRLAENGCQVIVPVLIDRQDTWSGNPRIRMTNQPHREWIYRQAFEMGRHIIGYEVQKVLAAVDWLARESEHPTFPQPALRSDSRRCRLGVAGYAEGGLIALYSAALDTRIDAALVSGYFESRQLLWEEPIYRNVFGLLLEFGDAEIASLIAPRTLIVEHSRAPEIAGPPPPREGRSGAAPGRLATPEFASVESEVARANALCPAAKLAHEEVQLVHGSEGMTVSFGSPRALTQFLKSLGASRDRLDAPGSPAADARGTFDPAERQNRQVTELERFTQRLLLLAERERETFFWRKLRTSSPQDWEQGCQPFKQYLWDEVIGRLPAASLPLEPRTRKLYDQPKWTGYEVVLDVWPDVFAWGYLLVPKNMAPGERRPVVVCQHGLEGVPAETVTTDPQRPGYGAYKGFTARLAERGFVTYAPHNPYRGQTSFRQLQRLANPLKKSLFSVILAQHDRTLDWLTQLPFVDASRIGFYGLSYGGKTAMRVPALLDRYCLSICSADFNDWVRKNVTTDSPYSYMFVQEYELPEFNLGHTFNYAEMAALIAPRPFMVERGHNDGVAPDEWVAYEYAKVRRLYAHLGIPQRTAIEFFNGPHTINGVGTFEFLHQHLNWPKPER